MEKTVTDITLAKYFSGEATPEEMEIVRNWAEQSPQNKEQFTQMQIVWADTGHVAFEESTSTKKYDVDAAWKNVQKRKSATPVEKSTSTSWLFRIAATVVILIRVGWIMRSYFSTPELISHSTEATTSPLALADGSKILLNANSSIQYPKEFDGDERRVKLNGEAFFEVTPDADRPFVIEAGKTEITVLGTSFNVNMDGHAVVVIVETGRVRFSQHKDQVILTAGMRGIYDPENGLSSIDSKTSSIGTEQFWRTRTLSFSAHSLSEVAKALEKSYGVSVQLEKQLENCSITVTFEDESLDNILDVIAMTLNVEVVIKGDNVLISGEGCTAN